MPPQTGVDYSFSEDNKRTFRFTMPALKKLQRQLGGEPLAVTLQYAAQMSADAIVALTWAALQHETKPPSIDQVAAMIQPPLRPLVEALTKALDPWGEGPDEGKAPEPEIES